VDKNITYMLLPLIVLGILMLSYVYRSKLADASRTSQQNAYTSASAIS